MKTTLTALLLAVGLTVPRLTAADQPADLNKPVQVCTVHDLHATMLHQLGIQHDAFSVKFQGLDAKLTGVEKANVLKDILA